MTIITLTSDWGCGNHYAGAVKGTLLKLIPGATIVDITHQVPSFDIMQASFVLKNSWQNFPEGTVHLLGMNTEAGLQTPHVAVRHQGHFFVGADNGVFSLLFDNAPDEVVELEILQDTDYFTFSTRDVFAKAAAMIAEGKSLDSVGKPYQSLNQRIPFKPVVHPDRIIGKVIFVDDYENVFVNIDYDLFRKTGKGRPFHINFRGPDNGIARILSSYSDVVPGEKLAMFSSTGFLEIAINQGKASSLLGLQMNDTVSIDFNKEPEQ